MTSGPAADRPLVIGVGNPMRGDDGAGVAVIAELEGRALDSDLNLDLVEADGEATRLIDLWDGRRRVVVVDACCSVDAPGTVTTRDAATAPPGGAAASSHSVGVAHAVELAGVLGRLPGSLVLVTIEGAVFELGAPLSPAIATAVPLAAAHVLAELASGVGWDHG
jgi:hydrogenase maturation protease